MAPYLWLVPLGFLVGAFGTLIGAGGGFILAPVLLLIYPNERPEVITSISLAVVFFNALSGSAAYAKMKRIHYRSGLIFAAATIPGAALGALSTAYVPRRLFDLIFGLVVTAASAFLLMRRPPPQQANQNSPNRFQSYHLVDAEGNIHTLAYNAKLGVGLSFIVGYLSSFFGIGGGIIHVPMLVYLLNFPVHIATATSHFILVIMAFVGSAVHLATGTLFSGWQRMIFLAVGVLIGAQLGAQLSTRVKAVWITRTLAVGLALIGIRLLIKAL